MERYILKIHFTPKKEAIEKGHKEHDWFYGKGQTTLLDCPDGWSHPETGHLTTNQYLLKEYGYSRKCDAVRAMNYYKKFSESCTDRIWWDRQIEMIVVTV